MDILFADAFCLLNFWCVRKTPHFEIPVVIKEIRFTWMYSCIVYWKKRLYLQFVYGRLGAIVRTCEFVNNLITPNTSTVVFVRVASTPWDTFTGRPGPRWARIQPSGFVPDRRRTLRQWKRRPFAKQYSCHSVRADCNVFTWAHFFKWVYCRQSIVVFNHNVSWGCIVECENYRQELRNINHVTSVYSNENKREITTYTHKVSPWIYTYISIIIGLCIRTHITN